MHISVSIKKSDPKLIMYLNPSKKISTYVQVQKESFHDY
jgi:hypothetical protein